MLQCHAAAALQEVGVEDLYHGREVPSGVDHRLRLCNYQRWFQRRRRGVRLDATLIANKTEAHDVMLFPL